MNIKRFTLGDLRVNCYVVYKDKKAYIIDPGYASQEVIDFIKENQLEVQFIYITHGHPDHIGGIDFTNKHFNVAVYAPIKDKWWIKTYGPSKGLNATITDWVSEPFTIDFLDVTLQIYETPGHSEGSTVIYDEENKYLFAGDTLFFETVGRTDIPYADKDVLVSSVKRMYDSFPNDTVVYPGHGKETTIGHESQFNYFVKKSTQ